MTSASALNFAATDFVVTDETGGQAGVALDYTNLSGTAAGLTAGTATTANALTNSDAAGQSAITAINSASTGTINAARIAALSYISTSLTSANIIVGNGSNVATGVAMSGDITIDNLGATTIGNSKVTLAKMADMATSSIIGRKTAGTGAPEVLSASDVKTILAIANTDVSGLGTMSTQNSNSVSISGGSMSGLTSVAATTFTGALTGNADTVTGLSVTSGKTLTVQKSMTFTAADDTGVYTLPTGTKTLVATDVTTLSSLTSVGTLTALTVSGAVAANGNTTLGDAATDQITLTGEIIGGATPLRFEGATDDNIYTQFTFTDPTVSSKTITFPNASITVNAAGDLSGTTLASGVTGSSLTSVGTLTSLSMSGALSGVTTISSSGDWTWTAGTPSITINNDETFTITDASTPDTFTINTSGSLFSFSDGTNSFTFDVDGNTGPVFAGTARPVRKVTLSPEFSGAVLTGDGGSNTGTMTTDFCAASSGVGSLPTNINTSVCNTAGDTHNYYQWTTTQGTAQDYDIWIKWRVPDNFSAWAASNPVKVYAKTNDATNGDVKLYIYDTANTVETNANNADITTSANSWLQTSISSLGGTYTAGSYMTIRVVMNAAATSGVTQVGEINLDYLSTN